MRIQAYPSSTEMSRRLRCRWSQLVSILFSCVTLLPFAALFAHSTSPSTNFAFPGFRPTDPVVSFGDVEYNLEKLSFILNPNPQPERYTGKLLFSEQVRMKNNDSNVVASFSTCFTFSITQGQYPPMGRSSWLSFSSGFMFAFFTENVNYTSNSRILNRRDGFFFSRAYPYFFSVEFDTHLNYVYEDPSDNHIGININGLKSFYTHNLCGGKTTYCSFPWDGRVYTAWIDYHGSTQSLEVRLANGSMTDGVTKPAGEPLFVVPKIELVDAFDIDYMYVGFIGGATGLYVESHEILSWNFASSFAEEFPSSSSHFSLTLLRHLPKMNVLVIFGFAFATFFAVIQLGILCSCWKKEPPTDKYDPTLAHLMGPRRFTLKELRKATKNFSNSLILGKGGGGSVYKGTLASSAMVVAVKLLKHELEQVEKEFLAEVSTISQIRHRNLVQLHGWCYEEGHFLLVYDYMSNGGLDEWIFPSRRLHPRDPKYEKFEILPWELRFSILAGVAAALEYLHEDWVQCVLHRDIKSSNVLLDADFNPHLGDFGLARRIDHEKLEKTTGMAGTLGYMAPELAYTGKATKESDCFSFGILMLEVLSGKKPVDLQVEDPDQDSLLIQKVWRAHETGNILSVVDSNLLDQIPSLVNFTPDEMVQSTSETCSNDFSVVRMDGKQLGSLESKITQMLRLGLQCCFLDPQARPSMRAVKQVIVQLQEDPNSMAALNLIPPLPSSNVLNPLLTSRSEASKSSKFSLEVVINMLQWNRNSKENTNSYISSKEE